MEVAVKFVMDAILLLDNNFKGDKCSASSMIHKEPIRSGLGGNHPSGSHFPQFNSFLTDMNSPSANPATIVDAN